MQEVPLYTRSSQRLADSCPHEQDDSGPYGRPASLNNQQWGDKWQHLDHGHTTMIAYSEYFLEPFLNAHLDSFSNGSNNCK